MSTLESGFTGEDFAVLRDMAAESEGEPRADRAAIDRLWEKGRRLVGALGAELFGADASTTALWPDGEDGDRLPFLWARIKRTENRGFATHVGLFLSPGACNLCLDLEKDRIDDATAAERLPQVLAFYRERAGHELAAIEHPEACLWTDRKNVASPKAFRMISLDDFMAANIDHDHPWPRVGYRFDAAMVQGFGNDWVAHMARRGRPLVPIYDAMIRSYRG